MTKQQAIMCHALLYTACYDIKGKTKIVNTWLRQIRTGLKKMKHDDYMKMAHETHKKWEDARYEVMSKDEKETDIKMSEFLATIYNAMPAKYQNIYYTDKTFTKVINSFMESKQTRTDDEVEISLKGREFADAFLKNIGVEVKSKLKTKFHIIKENLILDRKIA